MKIFFLGSLIAALLLAGLCSAEEAVEGGANETVTVQGTIINMTTADMPGAADSLMLNVSRVIEGGEPCTHEIMVTTFRATPPPWGSVEEGLGPEDFVEVMGMYTEDESGCSITLQGSSDYYVRMAAEPTENATSEAAASDVVY